MCDEDEVIGFRPAQVISTTHEIISHVCIPGIPLGSNQPFCPARPKGQWPHTDKEITEWVKEVIILGKSTGVLYMPEAMCYFATHCFWPLQHNGSEWPHYDRVRKLVWEVADKEYKSNIGPNKQFIDDAPDVIETRQNA